MAKESNSATRGILGDIDPIPAARDHIEGPAGVEDNDEDTDRAGSRDVAQRTTGNAGTEVGGTRNYRTGTGATGGDLGNRPE